MKAIGIEEKILRRIPLEIILISFFVSLASLAFFDALSSLFIFSGGAFSALSFFWLNRSLSKLLMGEKKKALKSTLIFYLIRLVLILTIFFIIIFFFSKKIIAFIAGFSIIILVIFLETLVAAFKGKEWKN